MATYIQGVTDYIPEIQPFKPDLNFYTKVLQTKQSQYDSALQSVNNLYGSLLYSPLSAQDNIKKRDDYFKMIEQDLKKITDMDLSLPQNQTIAQRLFTPILEDKNLMKDYSFTKHTMGQIDYGKSFTRCNKPEDCPGGYWKEGIDYLYLKLDEFAKASPDKRLGMQNPSYVPWYNLSKNIVDWAKDKGFVVSAVYNNGRYIIKKQNGQELEPHLQEMFMGVFAKDPKYQAMFNVKSVMQRKAFIDQMKGKYNGDENKAEEAWFNQVMNITGKRLQDMANASEKTLSSVRTKKQAYADMIKQKGVVKANAANDPILNAWMSLSEDETVAVENNSFFSGIKDLMSNMNKDPENRDMLRSRIDDLVAAGLLSEEVTQVTKEYAALNNAVTDMSADPFYMEAVQHGNRMAEKEYDRETQRLGKVMDFYKDLIVNSMKGGSGKASSLYMQRGAGSLDNPMIQPTGPGNTTGGFGTPGAPDFYAIERQAVDVGLQQQDNYSSDFMSVMMGRLDNIITSNEATVEQKKWAKTIKGNILGKNYDPTLNKYKNGNDSYDTFTSANYTAEQKYAFFNDAKIEADKNQVFLGTAYYDLLKLKEEENVAKARVSVAWDHITRNNTAIREYVNNNRNKFGSANAFLNMFQKQSDGTYYIKGRKEYIADAIKAMPQIDGNLPQEEREKIHNGQLKQAEKDYNTYFQEYKKLYHSDDPQLRDKITSPNGMTVGRYNANGRFSNVLTWDFDKAAGEEANGNQAFYDMYQMLASGSNLKILTGPASSSYTAENLQNAQDDLRARQLLTEIFNDYYLNDHSSESAMAKRPRGRVSRAQIAGNDFRKRSITIYPSFQYLKDAFGEMESAKATGKTFKAYGLDLDAIALNGITMYFDGNDDKGKFEKDFNTHPYTIALASGIKLNVSAPGGTGGVSIYKKGNKVVLDGTLNQLDGMNKVINTTTFTPAEYAFDFGNTGDPRAPGGDFDPGMIVAGMEELVRQLYTRNYYASQGVPVDMKSYDPNELANLVLNTSYRRGMADMPFQQEQQINQQKFMQEQMQNYYNLINSPNSPF